MIEQEIKDYHFLPRAVVESRFSSMKLVGYVAEISWYGLHYILSEPLKTSEEAQAIADKKVIEVKEAMLNVARPILAKYKIARV